MSEGVRKCPSSKRSTSRSPPASWSRSSAERRGKTTSCAWFTVSCGRTVGGLGRGPGLHRRWRRGLSRVRRDVAFVFQEHHFSPASRTRELTCLQMRSAGAFKTIKQRALETLDSLALSTRNAYRDSFRPASASASPWGALAAKPRSSSPTSHGLDRRRQARIVMRCSRTHGRCAAVIVASHNIFPSSRVLKLPSERIHLNGSAKAASNGNGKHARRSPVESSASSARANAQGRVKPKQLRCGAARRPGREQLRWWC